MYQAKGHEGRKRLVERLTAAIGSTETVQMTYGGTQWMTAEYIDYVNGDTHCVLTINVKDGDLPFRGEGFAFISDGDVYDKGTGRVLSFYRAMADASEDIEAVYIASVKQVPKPFAATLPSVQKCPEVKPVAKEDNPDQKFWLAYQADPKAWLNYYEFRRARHDKWHIHDADPLKERNHTERFRALWREDFAAGDRAPVATVRFGRWF